ncbi:MAG: tetratricopeptide repeat protein [Planctomycetia bacterium]
MPRILASLLLVLCACLAPAGAARADGEGTAQAEALEARWRERPDLLTRGLPMVEAWTAAGHAERARKGVEERLGAAPGDLVASFLAGWLEGGERGCARMWAAVRARLGQPEGSSHGLPEAYDALARFEEARGQRELALLALEQRVALAPTAAAWLRIGWLREQAGLLAPAVEAYRAARTLAPEHGPTRNALALALARTPGKSREARKLVEEGIANQPEAADSWLHLGLVKALAGDQPGAVTAYEEALHRAQRDPALLRVLAAALTEVEQWDLAAKAMASAGQLEAPSAQAVLQAAALAVQREEWDAARKLLVQAARLSPKDAQVAFLQGVVAQRTQQPDTAVAAYRKAMALDPAQPRYALALVAALLEREQVDAAIEVLREAAKAHPAEAGIPLRLGFALMQKKRWAQAVEAFREAARLAPADPDPHFYLAVLYGDRLGNLEQARLHLQEYKSKGGKEPRALAWLATLSK